MEDSIIVDIKFNVPETLKQLAELNAKIIALKEAQKGLDKGSIEFAKQSIEIKNAQQAARAYENQLKSQMAIQSKEINTLETMRQKLTGMKSVLSQMEVGSEAFETQQKAVNELNDELKELESAYGDNQRQVGTYENATKALRTQMREYRDELAQMVLEGKKGTKEFNELALKAGMLKDAMDDAQGGIDSFADDTQKVQAVSDAFSVMQQTLSQTSIALETAGVDTGNLSKYMAVLGGIIGALSTYQKIYNALQKEGNIQLILSGVSAKATSIMYSVFGASVIGASGALNIFGKALIATGIGAIVVALGLLIANFDKIINLFSKSGASASKAEEANKAYTQSLEKIRGEMNSLNEQSEIFNENLKRTTDLMLLEARKRGASAEELARIEIDAEKSKLEELKKQRAQREELALQGIEAAKKQVEAQEDYVAKLSKTSKKYDEQVAKLNDYREALAKQQKGFRDIGIEINTLTVSIENSEISLTETIKKENKQRAESYANTRKERLAKEREATQQLEDLILDGIKDEVDRAKRQREVAGEREIEALRTRLKKEKNLSKEAKESISQMIILLQKKTAEDVAKIQEEADFALSEKAILAEQERINLVLQTTKKGSEEEFELRKTLIENERTRRLAVANLTTQEIENINRESDLEIWRAKREQLDFEFEETRKLTERDFALKLQMARENDVERAEIELEQALLEKETLENLDAETKERLFATQLDYELAVIESNNRIKDSTQKVAEAQLKSIENQAKVLNGFSNAMTDIFGAVAGDTEAFAKFQKAVALAQAGVELGLAIASATSVATKGDPYTVALRIAAAVAGVVTSFAAVTKSIEGADIPTAPKFRDGGFVPGGQFSGDTVPIWANSGEMILNKNQQSRLDDLLFGGGQLPSIDYVALAEAFKDGVSKLPAPVLDYSEFTEFTNNTIKYNEYANI